MAAGSVGVVLVVVASLLLAHRRTLPTGFGGSAPTGTATTTAASAPPSTAAVPLPTTSGPTPPPVVTDPTSLRLDAFGVTAPVVQVASAAGRLDPPDDPAQVGWWLASAPPGAATGTTVVVGHVDGPAGPGAFYRLVHARPGDVVTLAGHDGDGVAFRVVSLQYVAKTAGLPAALFDQTGPARLVLVSCGGTFDRTTDEYAENVVVTAVPV